MEDALLQWFAAHRTPGSLDVARAVTRGGDAAVLIGAAIAGTVFLLRRQAYRPAAFYALLCLAATAVNFGLKYAVDRPRPVQWFAPGISVASPSFPSGHALLSTVIYGGFVWLVFRRRAIPAILTILLVGAIGLSRLLLGVHYPSDVLTGWALGVWLIMTLHWIYDPAPRP